MEAAINRPGACAPGAPSTSFHGCPRKRPALGARTLTSMEAHRLLIARDLSLPAASRERAIRQIAVQRAVSGRAVSSPTRITIILCSSSSVCSVTCRPTRR